MYAMPVVLDDHIPDPDLEPGTLRSDVVKLIYSNPELGFDADDVASDLGVADGDAKLALQELHEQNYVGRTADGYYYALDREDLHRYASSLRQVDRMFSESVYIAEHDCEYEPGMTDEEAEEELAAIQTEIDNDGDR